MSSKIIFTSALYLGKTDIMFIYSCRNCSKFGKIYQVSVKALIPKMLTNCPVCSVTFPCLQEMKTVFAFLTGLNFTCSKILDTLEITILAKTLSAQVAWIFIMNIIVIMEAPFCSGGATLLSLNKCRKLLPLQSLGSLPGIPHMQIPFPSGT